MRVQHNIMAMNSYRNLSTNNSKLSGNLEKLSSGYRINRAGDDAAGLAISEKMRAQITGLDAAQKNVNDGISLVKTSEGAMQEIQDMLNRMEYLADQSANGTYENEVDRENLQKEVTALKTEIDRIADSSNFNGISLMDGSQAAVASISEGTEEITVDDETGDAYKTTLDFASQSYFSLIGKSFSVEGNELKFVSKATDPDDPDPTEIVITKTDDAATIAGKVQAALAHEDVLDSGSIDDGHDWLVAQEGTKVTIRNNTLISNDGARADVQMKGITMQIGDSANSYNQMKVSIGDLHTKAMGDSSGLSIAELDISTQAGAQAAIETIKNAINYVSSVRGDLGAIQNRLEHTNNNLAVMEENITDAESTIRDTDVADEMMDYTKNNILIQSAQAMLAQANQVPQGVLQLMQ